MKYLLLLLLLPALAHAQKITSGKIEGNVYVMSYGDMQPEKHNGKCWAVFNKNTFTFKAAFMKKPIKVTADSIKYWGDSSIELYVKNKFNPKVEKDSLRYWGNGDFIMSFSIGNGSKLGWDCTLYVPKEKSIITFWGKYKELPKLARHE